ncbi:uncharacterized protein MYCGRDRAFT_106011 [Zymoseptoria tritici IPO323]|uniref:Uncharacterized protein n=1 Tax=Zymoseptoria tritici (strain CBS 115943 / IPO323) TaxID=336722 RepID=F9XLT1_ZYMTI|nr:uncharacterized protein MYCGRDRAFT_106011 [Zymoseptoria tritici IPO323]EGP83915.1 hypothetical protein MYCGRDRAFT_106011 [Zymoseptoria tritici IPO323]
MCRSEMSSGRRCPRNCALKSPSCGCNIHVEMVRRKGAGYQRMYFCSRSIVCGRSIAVDPVTWFESPETLYLH